MKPLLTCSVDDLYESIETRGGITARMRLEQLASDIRAEAGTVAQPLFTEDDEEPDTLPFMPTVPSRETLPEGTGGKAA